MQTIYLQKYMPSQKPVVSGKNANLVEMSRVSSSPCFSLQSFFQKLKEKTQRSSNKLQHQQDSIDNKLQLMLKQAKLQSFSRQESTFCEFSKQNTLQNSKSSLFNNQKVQSNQMIQQYLESIRSRYDSNQRSRTREKIKKSKKRSDSKKDYSNQTRIQKYFPNLSNKHSKKGAKKVVKRQKQLTLQFFLKEKPAKQKNNGAE